MASNMPKSDNFLVGPVTLSYVDGLFEARSVNGSEPKFGCNAIFDDAVAQQIQAQIDAIGQAAFPNEWHIPNKCHKPIRSVAEKPAYQQAGRGAWFANISSKFAPQVVDQNKQPVVQVADPMTNRKPIYGGVKAYIYINVYAYRHPQGGPGVSLGVSAVMKYLDAEPLVEQGQVDVASAFANVPTPPPAEQAPSFNPNGAAPAQPAPAQPAPPAFNPNGGYNFG